MYHLGSIDGETKLGKWLGPATDYGAGDGFWLLPISSNPIVRSTVWSLLKDDLNDLNTDVWMAEMKKFLEVIAEKIGDDFGNESNAQVNNLLPDHGDLFADNGPVITKHPKEAIPDVDKCTSDIYDQYITMEMMIPIGDK